MKNITLLIIIIFITAVSSFFIFSKINSGDNSYQKIIDKLNLQQLTNKDEAAYKLNQLPKLQLSDSGVATLENKFVQRNNAGGFTFAEVAQQNTLYDCYLIVNGNVYNISPYIPYHPAGSHIINKYCGQEVTGIFAQIHSNRAWDLLRKYKVGVISTRKYNTMPKILSAIAQALQNKNPSLRVIKIRPKKNKYVAKVILNGKFYEIHIDSYGRIIKKEMVGDENWAIWNTDIDDR